MKMRMAAFILIAIAAVMATIRDRTDMFHANPAPPAKSGMVKIDFVTDAMAQRFDREYGQIAHLDLDTSDSTHLDTMAIGAISYRVKIGYQSSNQTRIRVHHPLSGWLQENYPSQLFYNVIDWTGIPIDSVVVYRSAGSGYCHIRAPY